MTGDIRSSISLRRVTVFCAEEDSPRVVRSGKTASLAPWIAREEFVIHSQILREGDYTGPLNWYKHLEASLSFADERELKTVVHVPILLVTAKNDQLTILVVQEQMTRPYIKNLRVKCVDSEHWVRLEAKDEVNAMIEELLLELAEC